MYPATPLGFNDVTPFGLEAGTQYIGDLRRHAVKVFGKISPLYQPLPPFSTRDKICASIRSVSLAIQSTPASIDGLSTTVRS